MNQFDVRKVKNAGTGQKGYVPAMNGRPLTQKVFRRRQDAQKFLDELLAALLAKRDEAEKSEVTAAEVEAAFKGQNA